MPKEPGSMMKVRYTGNRIAAFRVTTGGVSRLWAAKSSGANVATARWLPRNEALAYGQMPDFAIVKQQSAAPARPHRKKVRGKKNEPPAAPAVPVAVLLAAAEAIVEEPEITLPPFVMSRAGVVHRRTCVRRPKVPIAELDSLAEAREHSRFSRFHRSCIEV